MQPTPLHPADLAIRDRILKGDRVAAEQLFTEHVEALFEFVHYRVGRDRQSTEDVVQDTLLVAFDRLASFDGRSSLHTWLCGIAKNKIRSRGRKRRPIAIEDLLAGSDAEIDSILANIEHEPLPEEVLEARETKELVGATLASLPPNYRQALVEKYVEGRTVPEMARTSGRKLKAAESNLHRAKLAFARVFQLLAGKRGDVL